MNSVLREGAFFEVVNADLRSGLSALGRDAVEPRVAVVDDHAARRARAAQEPLGAHPGDSGVDPGAALGPRREPVGFARTAGRDYPAAAGVPAFAAGTDRRRQRLPRAGLDTRLSLLLLYRSDFRDDPGGADRPRA